MYKKLLLVIFGLISYGGVILAATNESDLLQSCPTGHTTIVEPDVYIFNTVSSCPSGYTSVGGIDADNGFSCLEYPNARSCMMYIPANFGIYDTTGNYVYTDVCPLTN